jgi:hypothetical protein
MRGYGIIGQINNAPADVNNTVTMLPRHLDGDYSFNVYLKKNLIQEYLLARMY